MQGALPEDVELSGWLKDFDTNSDGSIGQDEFMSGMAMWLRHVQESIDKNSKAKKGQKPIEM